MLTVRSTGTLTSVRGCAPHDHVCWAYTRRGEYRARAGEFVADGVAAGQFVLYAGDGPPAALRAELAGLGGGAALRDGMADVCALDSFYIVDENTTVIDPEATVERGIAAVEQALDNGYTGFRMVVDATPVVDTPAQREAFARYEHLADQALAALPATALCGYDVTRLGQAAVAELACLHPLATRGATEFRLYAEPDGELALAGELDPSSHDLLARRLDHLAPGHGELVVDARDLGFVDHRSLILLAERARRNGATVAVRNPSASTRRMIDILRLPELRAGP